MSMRFLNWPAALTVFVAASLGSCATDLRPVIDRLDETTGVTVTHSRTPFVLQSGETADSFPQVDLLQMGVIEINRMGARDYYLWLGITEYRFQAMENGQPPQFQSIVLLADEHEIALDTAGWSHAAIGTSEPVYRRMFDSSIDAYYPIGLGQIEMLVAAENIRLLTAEPDSRMYSLSFDAAKPAADLREFHRAVSE